jgi:hypothetical protein
MIAAADAHLPIPLRRARLYERHAAAADRGGWSVERDVAWSEIDHELAHARPDLLAALRDAAVIESFHPVHLGGLLRAAWDDVDAGVALSLEMYEGFKHFHALRRYLDAVRYTPAITDAELVAVRAAARGDDDEEERPLLERLVDFMLSEHLAYYFFRRVSEQTREPVLAAMLVLIAADEVRHAQSASDLIAKRIAADPACAGRVLDAAARFRHVGELSVGNVPVVMAGDPLAIRTFARRIERLCGVRLVDHLKGRL